MSKTFRDWVPEQNMLMPASMLDWIPREHLVHVVLSLVRDELDLKAIMGKYQEERGCPPFHPAMMVGLLLYAYSQRIYSSRRIAQACEQRVDFMVLTGRQTPDFRTINLFRLRHLRELKGLFQQVLRLCQKAGLARVGHVALDGTKMRANASKDQTMQYGQMAKTEKQLQGEIDGWFKQAEQIDNEEDERYGREHDGEELPAWVADKQKRLEKIRQAKAELEAEAHAAAQRAPDPTRTKHEAKPDGIPKVNAHKNFTDRDSQLMKSRDGFIQGYNCQAAVDADSQVIVAQQVAPNGSDMHQLTPLLKQIRCHLKRQAREVSADAGYSSEHNLKEIRRRHIRGYVANRWQKDSVSRIAGRKPPAGIGPYVRQMWQRLRRGSHRTRYRLRKQVVEPVFGQIKHARGFRQFLLRGAEKVAGEWSLLCTVHNMLKLAAVAH